MAVQTYCPWRITGFNYDSTGINLLHQEIEHFYSYIQPTAIEFAMRYRAIRRAQDVIQTIWPKAIIEVFGSFRAGLHLPGSDVDMVVLGVWDTVSFYTLESELLESEVALKNSTLVLDKASVPVVKFTDSQSHIKFDISFNVDTGVQAAELVKEYKRIYPQMPKLVMILKHFLMQNNLNEVYSGGISSYGLTLMCIAFLQTLGKGNPPRKLSRNLGVLLLKFLEYYGRKFDYSQHAITILNTFGYMDKSEFNVKFGMQWQSALTIEDPLVPGNDIGRNSFAVHAVKQLFELTYVKLSKIVDSAIEFKKDEQNSILGCMIEVPTTMLNYREWVHYNFRHLVKCKHNHINKSHWLDYQSEDLMTEVELNKLKASGVFNKNHHVVLGASNH